jgi:hypothetical protein
VFAVLFLIWTAPVAADFIYWSTVNHIKRANLDGTDVETIMTATGTEVGGIAFDVAHGYLYSGDTQFIFRTNLDGSSRVNLAPIGGPGKTGDVELDLVHGKIYWTTAAAIPTQVFRANLDGSNVQTLFTRSSANFEGLAIDPGAGKLYYAIANTIMVSNLDGSGASVFKTLSAGAHDVEIDVAGGKLYWDTEGFLQSANLDGSGGIENLLAAAPGSRFTNGLDFDPVDHVLYYTLEPSPRSSTLVLGRINADGTGNGVLLTDLDGINYPAVLHLPQDVTAAPEPATLTLLGAGLLSLLGYGWRRRHAA